MTTKAQERKALEQIKKIIEGLGENSYVGTAFEGCFEIAEENIENDFACSMKQRADAAQEESEYFHKIANDEANEIDKLEGKIELLKKELDLAKQTIRQEADRANAWIKEATNERKDVKVGTTDGQEETKPFARIQFFNNDGFKFINIVEKSGWTNSYKIDDLTTLIIE